MIHKQSLTLGTFLLRFGEACCENWVVQSNFHFRKKTRASMSLGCLKTTFIIIHEQLQFRNHFQSPEKIYYLAFKFFLFKEMIVFVLPQKINRLELTFWVNFGLHFFLKTHTQNMYKFCELICGINCFFLLLRNKSIWKGLRSSFFCKMIAWKHFFSKVAQSSNSPICGINCFSALKEQKHLKATWKRSFLQNDSNETFFLKSCAIF